MGIQVLLKNRTGVEVARTTTDSKGRFQFGNLPPGIYVVAVYQNEYLERPQQVDLSFTPNARLFVDLVPNPKQTEGPASGAVPAAIAGLSADAQKAFLKGSELLFKDKNADKSIEEFKKVEKLEPNFVSGYVHHSVALMQMQKYDEAQPILRGAVKRDAKDFSANFYLGVCLNSQQKFSDAEPFLKSALSLKEASPEANYELSRALVALGRWQEAEPLANKSRELAPQFAATQIVLGNISLRKRDASAALQHFQEYLRLDPQGPFGTPAREMVSKIQAALYNPK
jgi:tetratricopeptide (TPR) repeat protein